MNTLSDLFDPSLILAMASAFVAVLAITPNIITYALKINWVDQPNGRKLHTKPTPSIGGLVLIPSIVITWIIFSVPEASIEHESFIALLVAIIILYLVGLYDDRWPLSHRIKLPIQLILSASLIQAMDILPLDFNGVLGIGVVDGWWGFLLTLFFFLFTINAVNFIDGINGLLGTYVVITLSVLGIVFLALDINPGMAWLMLVMASGTMAYLFFNFRKTAKTFMGDAGSTVIGLIIATAVSMWLSRSHSIGTMPSFFFVAVLFWYPLIDSLMVYIRRMLRGKSPFKADNGHIHHLLLKRLSPNHIVITLVISLTTVVLIGLMYLQYHHVG